MTELFGTAALIHFLAVYYGYLYYFGWNSWRDFARAKPGIHFNFHITDIWAAIVGLTPSTMLAAYVIADHAKSWGVPVLAVIVPAQVMGMFRGRLRAQREETASSRGCGAIESAVFIIVYTILALPFTGVFVIGFSTCLPAMAIYAVLYLRRQLREGKENGFSRELAKGCDE